MTTNSSATQQAQVIVGPVIGLVEQTTARILLEVDKDATVTMLCRPKRGHQRTLGKLCSLTLELQGKRVSAFVFKDLSPDTLYSVLLEGATPQMDEGGGYLQSSFRTLPQDLSTCKEAFQFVALSCNDYTVPVEGKYDMCRELWRVVRKGRVRFIAHIGDQVYSDPDFTHEEREPAERGEKPLDPANDDPKCKYRHAMLLVQGLPPDQWETKADEIRECYRQLYRDTWAYPPLRRVLANVSNLTILDDHEIRDDWGDRFGIMKGHCDADTLPQNPAFFISSCALDIYCEYQRALVEDNAEKATKIHHFHKFGPFGFMFTESRACKTFFRKPEDATNNQNYLGAQQWADIRAALAPDGMMTDIKCLFFISPVPVAQLGTKEIQMALRANIDDVLGAWDYEPYQPEQKTLLNLLLQWKHADRTRELVIVSGDSHFSGFSDLFEEDAGFAFKQVITSALRCIPMSKVEIIGSVLMGKAASAVAEMATDIPGTWVSSQYGWQRFNNFCVMTITRMPRYKAIRHPQTYRVLFDITHTSVNFCVASIGHTRTTSTHHADTAPMQRRCFCCPVAYCGCLPL